MAEKTEKSEESKVLDSLGSFKEIKPYDTEDYVVEGTPEAEQLQSKPPETKSSPELSLSKEELKAQLDALQAKIQAQAHPQVVMPPPAPEKVETPEERTLRLNNLWLENPSKAFQEQSILQVKPIVDLLFQQGAVLSRELLLRDPEQKKLYDKYKDEVESEVQKIPPQERATEPRVYQVALERVKAKHMDDVFEEKVKAAVEERLKELGLGPKSEKGPATFNPTKPPQLPPQGGAPKKVIPRSIVEEAHRIGLDPEFLYEHRKEQGLIK